MGEEEIRRRKTADPEMDAIIVIAQALASLDAETCSRVLEWAKDRFIEQPKREIKELAWLSVDAQISAYKKYAGEMGLDDRKLAHAISHVRDSKRLAPIDHDPDPEDTIRKAKEELKAT